MIRTLYLWTVCLVAAMGGLLFGYDWVLIGCAKIFYEPFFGITAEASLRGFAMSCALLGCLVGALVSGRLCDRFGRRPMLIASALLFILTGLGTGAAASLAGFLVFRSLGGVAIGIVSGVSPVYIAELSPTPVRGRMVALNQLAIVVGILMAQVIDSLIGGHFLDAAGAPTAMGVAWAWRWMFWVASLPALVFFIAAFFLPESPHWLQLRGEHDKAASVWKKIGGEMLESPQQAEAGRSLPLSAVGRVLGIGIVLAVFQQWCGINVIFNYAHEIFSAAGYAVSDVLMNIVVTGITNLLFTFVAIFTVDRWGRRRLMLTGAGGLCAIYAVLAVCYANGWQGWPMLALVVLAIAVYAMSLAPVTWVVLSELFPLRVRGKAMALCTFSLWMASFILTYTFPLLNAAVGAAGSFSLYGLISLLGFLFIFFRLPETKGRELEQ